MVVPAPRWTFPWAALWHAYSPLAGEILKPRIIFLSIPVFQSISSNFIQIAHKFPVLCTTFQPFSTPTTWNAHPEKISIFLVFVYRRCCFFKRLFFSELITSMQQRKEGWRSIALHRQRVKVFYCHAHVHFASQRKKYNYLWSWHCQWHWGSFLHQHCLVTRGGSQLWIHAFMKTTVRTFQSLCCWGYHVTPEVMV